jgi:hypothetical protein
MANNEINLKTLKLAVNSVLDHLIEDLGLENVPIDGAKDYYWGCPAPEMYDMSTTPTGDHLTVGSLRDDMEFIRSVRRGESYDASINLVHVAPLLRYIADTIGQ